MDAVRKMALIVGLLTMLNPGTHVWFENNVLHMEKNGEVTEILYNHTKIGTAWSHTTGEEPVEQ